MTFSVGSDLNKVDNKPNTLQTRPGQIQAPCMRTKVTYTAKYTNESRA